MVSGSEICANAGSMQITYQNSNGWVMVRILDVVGHAFDDAEQVVNEGVINEHQVLQLEALDA